eukprot:2718353-Pyramimonas_sp.AAC.1
MPYQQRRLQSQKGAEFFKRRTGNGPHAAASTKSLRGQALACSRPNNAARGSTRETKPVDGNYRIRARAKWRGGVVGAFGIWPPRTPARRQVPRPSAFSSQNLSPRAHTVMD